MDFESYDLVQSEFANSDLESLGFNQTRLDEYNFTATRNYSINPIAHFILGTNFTLPRTMELLGILDVEIVNPK